MGSSNVTVTFVPTATSVAPDDGVRPLIPGRIGVRRLDGDRDRGGSALRGAVTGGVGEAVRAAVARGRRVGEGPVRVHGHRAVLRVGAFAAVKLSPASGSLSLPSSPVPSPSASVPRRVAVGHGCRGLVLGHLTGREGDLLQHRRALASARPRAARGTGHSGPPGRSGHRSSRSASRHSSEPSGEAVSPLRTLIARVVPSGSCACQASDCQPTCWLASNTRERNVPVSG